jgi:HK97 family phage prohead protease/HK97 family phage major capsid protein
MKRIPIQFKAGPDGLETKQGDARLEVKATGEGGILHIKAYALAFGNIDSWGDIIMPGALDEFLKSDAADRMALCYQHERRTVIGKITDKGVDDYGMWIEADILPTEAGKDAAILIKSGAIKEFSIGYRADRYHYEKREGYEYDIRILDAITVYECSPVTIAANPSAIVVSAKADPNHINNNPKPQKTMTPEEIKAMRESIEKEATEKVASELKAKIEEIQAKQEKIDAQEKSIDNLDQTIKAQQETIKALEEKFKEKARETFIGAFKAAVEEHKEDIESLIKSGNQNGSMKFEFGFERKDPSSYDVTVAGDITRIAWGGVLDPKIYAARTPALPFYEVFNKQNVNGLFVHWLEGTYTDQTDYVDELAAMNDANAAAAESSRKLAKYGAHILLSSEVTDFFTSLYDWARGKAQDKLREFANKEIYAGLGADTNSTTKKKIYGLKSQATAFSGIGTYQDATIADLIKDAKLQAAKYGYNLNVAFMSWGDYATLNGLKDANGRSIWDDREEVTIQGVRIFPDTNVSSDDMLLADTSVVQIKVRPVYELEIVRNAKLDGWDVYLRGSLQTLVPSADQKGLIFIDAISTELASVNTAGPLKAVADVMTDVHDDTNHAIKTKAAGA